MLFHKCSAHEVRNFFINPRPACCEIEEGGGGERDTCRIVEVYCPTRIARGIPFHLLARQVEGGTRRGPPLPPVTHSPFQQLEATAVHL
jgi:hypothetical protein